MLGIEFLKLNEVSAAIAEFNAAIALLPRTAANHSNLGLALCIAGYTVEGLDELEKALGLDPSLLRARFLKGVILMERGLREHEAFQNLEAAQREVPTAHLALALFYVRQGQAVAADQQLHDYAETSGVTRAQAQNWLSAALAGVPVPEALGLWARPPASAH